MGAKHTNKIGRHKGQGQFIVVLVVDLPQRVFLWLVLFPEPREGNFARVFVGVLSLPVIENESRFGQCLKRVLGFDFGLGLILLFIFLLGWFLLGLWCSCSGCLGRLCFLLGWSVLDALIDQDRFGDYGLPDWLVCDGLIPTGGVWVFSTPFLVKSVLETTSDLRSQEQIGKGHTLSDEESVDKEVLFKDMDGVEGGFLGVIDGLLDVRVSTNKRAEPATEGWKDFGVGKGQPSHNGGIVLLGLSEESSLLVLRCDCL